MRSGAINTNMIIFLRLLKTTAELEHIVHGDDVIRFAEDSEHRTGTARDELVHRGGPHVVGQPLSTTDGAVEHDDGRDIFTVRRQEERLAARLADADNPETRA